MNVSLTAELEKFVHAKIGSGRYNSASEVVREALRLLEEHDQLRATRLAEFNQELGRRLASLDAGERVDPARISCPAGAEVATATEATCMKHA